MNRFTDVLNETAARLKLPQPAKSRILLEIAGDMEDVYRVCRERGLAREEAYREAVARFELSDDALADLVAVHTSRFRRFLDGLSEQGRSRAEQAALGLLILFVVATTGQQAAGSTFFAHASALSWPALVLTLLAIVVGARKAWALWLAQEHDARRLQEGLVPILVLGGMNVLLGFFGFWIEVQIIARRLAAGGPGADLVIWLRASAATVVVAMMSALICCLIWYVLAQRVATIQRAEVAYLLEAT